MLIAIDTGGTKTLAASFSADGNISSSEKFPTPRNQKEYVDKLIQVIKTLAESEPIDAIVVALPGIIRDEIAVWCSNLGWSNFDIKAPLKKAFPNTPILVENDANLAGLSETRLLSADKETFPLSLYVTISTGIGTGIITNNTLSNELKFSEGGKALVEFNGLVRQWQDFASGSAIKVAFGRYAKDIHSERDWARIADRISRGFLALIPMLQPDIIIIGGSIGGYFEEYNRQLIKLVEKKLPKGIAMPRFVKAKHPEEAVIYGCYYYALDQLSI